MRLVRRLVGTIAVWLAAALGAGLGAGIGRAEAACVITGVQSVSGATANLGRYDGLGAPIPQTLTLNLVLTVAGGGVCVGSVAFVTATTPAQMRGVGTDKLLYDMQTPSGASVLSTSAMAPSRALRFSASAGPTQSTISVPVQLRAVALPHQKIAAGGYSDAGVTIAVFDAANPLVPVGSGMAVARSAGRR